MNGLSDKKNSPQHRGESHPPFTSQEHLMKKKIQIKTQALMMMSQELDQCRMQRDRFKLMAEQLQEDLNRRKEMNERKGINGFTSSLESSVYGEGLKIGITDHLVEHTKLMDLLIEAREQNKCLRLQVDTMRHKLKESEEDIKALRSKKTEDPRALDEITPALHQREELIEQLERLNVKCMQLKLDLQAVLDEKHELEIERDAFKCKAHRLNHELSMALSSPKTVDVDALVTENRYLQERLQQLLEEKELAQQSVQKYKSMLDTRRQKGVIKLGGKSSVGSVMNFKQVEQLLQQGPNISPQKSAAALTELHSICTALLEALNDKNLALAHQKKANKILAARMCELDRAVQSPTMKLLEGYSNADVDGRCDSTSITSDLSEERSEEKESDLQCEESLQAQDTTNKQINQISIKESITNNQGDEYCEEENIETKKVDESFNESNIKNNFMLNKKVDESLSELHTQSNCKSFGYFDGSHLSRDTLKKVDLNVSLQSFPEHLRLLVHKYYNELKAKEMEKS